MSIVPGVSTVKGVFMTSKTEHSVQEVPMPSVVPSGLILVKVKAVAINPCDWKLPEFALSVPTSGVGCDFSGTVVALGSGVSGFKVGEQVFAVNSAYATPGQDLLGTGFAEYVLANPVLTFRAELKEHPALSSPDELIKPAPPSTFEGAAAVPLAASTAGLLLSHHFNDNIQFLPNGEAKTSIPNAASKYILIWGGATSVGQYAIQLAKAAGFKVVTTASPRNFEYLTKLGADDTVDYHQEDAVAQIKAIAGKNLVHVIDTISLAESWKSCYAAIDDEATNINIVAVLPVDDIDVGKLKPGVTMQREYVFIPSWNIFPLDSESPQNDGQRQYVAAAAFVKFLNARIAAGKFLHNPVRIYAKSGVEASEEAIEYFKTANVSAYKLVVKF